ncbi:MAG: hypothetical protein ACFFDN_33085, partial [Candidatus Hodarchaeota archaeon]
NMEFPIIGEYREIFIVLEIIIVLLSWEFGVIFLYNFYQNRKNQKLTKIELVWSILYFSFGLMNSFYQFSDFYYVDRLYFLFMAYISLAIGAFFFILHSERIGVINTRRILPIFSFSVCAILIISYIVDPILTQSFAYIALFPMSAFVILYVYNMFKYLKGKFKLYTLGLFTGIMLIFIGIMGQSDFAAEFFGYYIRVYADLLIILGLCSMAVFFYVIPSLSEIDWYDKLKGILVTTKEGICLYNENFIKRKSLDDDLLAASLAIIHNLLTEMTKGGKELKTLAKENEYFILDYGKEIVGILIATEELESLKILLREFIRDFEDFYLDTLKSWKGEVSLFSPTSFLVTKIFKKIQ